MKLFILEDDPIQRERLETIITKLQDTLQIFCEQLIATHDPEVLLSRLDVIDSHHVYFLDLEINHEVRMGLEVAQEIRKKDLHGMIVFVTTHSELAPKTYAYKVSALDFIEKDQPNEAFSQQVEACLVTKCSLWDPVNVSIYKTSAKGTLKVVNLLLRR